MREPPEVQAFPEKTAQGTEAVAEQRRSRHPSPKVALRLKEWRQIWKSARRKEYQNYSGVRQPPVADDPHQQTLQFTAPRR
jgi:hypothetical protein